mgnify:CR=1 FL=1
MVSPAKILSWIPGKSNCCSPLLFLLSPPCYLRQDRRKNSKNPTGCMFCWDRCCVSPCSNRILCRLKKMTMTRRIRTTILHRSPQRSDISCTTSHPRRCSARILRMCQNERYSSWYPRLRRLVLYILHAHILLSMCRIRS